MLNHLAAFGGSPHVTEQPTHWPTFLNSEITAVSEVLVSGRVNYWTGEHGRRFENMYAESLGRSHALCVANGTLALELALRAFRIGPDDEVIVPCRTFLASASCVVAVGATPVLVDVDTEHGLIDLSHARSLITTKTRAVIAVHVGGMPCDMTAVVDFAREFNLFVVEDCAQAHGARWKDREVGSFGDAAAFSFCQDKIITTGGEGGMLVLDDAEAFDRAWSYRDHGTSRTLSEAPSDAPVRTFRYIHTSFGSNWRLTEMQSVLGIGQLLRLPESLVIRRANAKVITEGLAAVRGIRVPAVPEHAMPSYYRLYLQIDPHVLAPGWTRNRVLEACAAEGIPCFEGSCSDIGLEQAMTPYAGSERPAAKALGAKSIALLVHPGLSSSYVAAVAEAIAKVMQVAVVAPWPAAD